MKPSITANEQDFLSTLKVLYVEDEQEVREAMTHFLSRRFARLDVAANGQEGLALFNSHPYDLVITDIKMPVMDGLEMAANIKTRSLDTPIIVVTAYNETDYFLRAIELGIDRYVKKPLDPNELVEAIQKSTQSHRHRKELEDANKNLLNVYQTAIGALARAIEIRDPYTNGHQKRVSQIAEAIALEMSLPASQITGIRLGAMIHDIGKISVPIDYLTMPRKLTNLEYALVKTHPQSGADILVGVEFPWPIAEMVLQHHERMDGSGYPRGLKKEEILLEARIIAVADVVDAMSSSRPYRAALGIYMAAVEIRENSGTLYDPSVVECCLKLIERGESGPLSCLPCFQHPLAEGD